MSTPIATEDKKPETIRRVFKGEVDDVEKSKRTVTHLITTDSIDRYKEVIVARGISLETFQSNPIVLWCHSPYAPIAKNLWIKSFKKDGRSGLIAKTLFAKTEYADEIFQLYAEGILNGWSIGGNPDWTKAGAPTEDEIKARPELKNCRTIYRKMELVEYSAVSIPANQDALGNEVGKSINAELRRQIENSERWDASTAGIIRTDKPAEPIVVTTEKAIELPPLTGRTFEQALAETKALVARMTSEAAGEEAGDNTIDRLKGRV